MQGWGSSYTGNTGLHWLRSCWDLHGSLQSYELCSLAGKRQPATTLHFPSLQSSSSQGGTFLPREFLPFEFQPITLPVKRQNPLKHRNCFPASCQSPKPFLALRFVPISEIRQCFVVERFLQSSIAAADRWCVWSWTKLPLPTGHTCTAEGFIWLGEPVKPGQFYYVTLWWAEGKLPKPGKLS